MIQACRQYGLPSPLFEVFGDGIKVTMFRKQADKQINKCIDTIMSYMEQMGEATTAEIAARLGLSPARTRAIFAKIDEIEAIGATNVRRYRLK